MKTADYSIRLERKPAGRRPRFYEISLCADLFGATVLHRRWGGVGQRGGRSLVESYATLTAARRAASAWLRRKRKRGYRAIHASGGS